MAKVQGVPQGETSFDFAAPAAACNVGLRPQLSGSSAAFSFVGNSQAAIIYSLYSDTVYYMII